MEAEHRRTAPYRSDHVPRYGSGQLPSVKKVDWEKIRGYYTASALYAYFYLFDSHEKEPVAYDRRFRLACDIYNRALGFAIKTNPGSSIALKSASIAMPTGLVRIQILSPIPGQAIPPEELFFLADESQVRGLSARDRRSGIGVPLVATPSVLEDRKSADRFLSSSARYPITAFLRIEGNIADFENGGLKTSLELYSPYQTPEILVNGRPVPLEADLTVPLAFGLEESPFWKVEWKQFFSGEQQIRSGVYRFEPFQPDKIPVVFIHGTASSPARWAEMFNTLRSDPQITRRFQFFYFIYNTGNPITYSAYLLRSSLNDFVTQMDPGQTNAALRQMVVVGHSQGGLLAKLAVIDSGEQFWPLFSRKPINQLNLDASERQLLNKMYRFHSSPWINRVVYIATPHRGSYRIKGIILRLAQTMITMPSVLARVSHDVLTHNPDVIPWKYQGNLPNSIELMVPDNPFLKTLDQTPVRPGVVCDSIIAVSDLNNFKKSTDGIVAYSSAHITNSHSETLIEDSHSCLNNAAAIEAVRQILLDQAQATAKKSE